MSVFKYAVSVLVIACWASAAPAQETTAETTPVQSKEPLLQTSDLKKWYCDGQMAIESVDFLRSWFDRVNHNAVQFVGDNGQPVASPVDLSWKKSPECINSERTNEKSEKSEKSG